MLGGAANGDQLARHTVEGGSTCGRLCRSVDQLTRGDFVELAGFRAVAQFRISREQGSDSCFSLCIEAVHLPDDRAIDCIFIDGESQRCFASGEAGFCGVLDRQVVATDRFSDDSIGRQIVELPLSQHADFIVRKFAAIAGRDFACRTKVAKDASVVDGAFKRVA